MEFTFKRTWTDEAGNAKAEVEGDAKGVLTIVVLDGEPDGWDWEPEEGSTVGQSEFPDDDVQEMIDALGQEYGWG